jgi:hypothetical protein
MGYFIYSLFFILHSAQKISLMTHMTNMGYMAYFFYPLSNSYSVTMARVVRMTHIAHIRRSIE